MTDKINIEDMTLSQIRKLKDDLKNRINDVLSEFTSKTGLHPTIKVTTEVEEMPLYFESYGDGMTARSEDCERIYTRNIDIDFNQRI